MLFFFFFFSERDEERAIFVAYFGAGFLVWYVYLSGLGVIVSFISVLWRFKVILGRSLQLQLSFFILYL